MFYKSIKELSLARNISLVEIGFIVGFTKTVAFRNFKRNYLNVGELMKIANYFNLVIEILPGKPPQEALLFHCDTSIIVPPALPPSPHKSINHFCLINNIFPFRDFIINSALISHYQFERRNNDNTKFRVAELTLLLNVLNVKAFIGSNLFILMV